MKKILLFLFAVLLMGACPTVSTLAQTIVINLDDDPENSGCYLLTVKTVDGTPTYTNSGKGNYKLPGVGQDSAPFYSKNNSSKIKRAKIDASMKDVYPTSTCCWFYGLGKLETIEGLSNLNTSSVTTMGYMFSGCSSLKNLEVSTFDTRNVTDMSNMFSGMSLASIDLKAFNTGNVVNMSNMFRSSSSLTNITFGTNFNTSQVTNMRGMFCDCSSLQELDLASFDTQNVTDMQEMFENCSSLTTLDLSNFNTAKVTNMWEMFWKCTNLQVLKASRNGDYWNTENVANMSRMFYKCYDLDGLDVSNWNVQSLTNMLSMFEDCWSLTSLDLSKWDTRNLTNMSWAFCNCRALKNLKLVNDDNTFFNPSQVSTFYYAFSGCKSLTELDVSKWDTGNVRNMEYTFDGCTSLQKLDVSKWNTGKVTIMHNMFCSCINLTELDVSKWNTANVTNMNGMFSECKNIKKLDVSNWDTQKVTGMGSMFSECKALTSIDIHKWNMSNVTGMSKMFYACSKLKSLDLSMSTLLSTETGNAKSDVKVKDMISGCRGLTELNLGGNDFSNYASSRPFVYVGQTYDSDKNKENATPCHITMTLDKSKLGTVIIDKDNEVPPYYFYGGGCFTVTDTLDCVNGNAKASAASKLYTPKEHVMADLWVKSRAANANSYALKANVWNTIVLPAGLTEEQRNVSFGSGAEVCVLSGYDGKTVTFKTLTGTTTANMPVLVKPTVNIKNLGFANVDITPLEGTVPSVSVTGANGKTATFYGSYNGGSIKIGTDCFYYYDGEFMRSAGNSTVACTRGYFKFSDVKESTGTTGAKMFAIDDGSTVTRIDAIDGKPVSTDGAVYNLSGQRVGDDYKGIVIVNGRKVLRR